jgi:uncharacterized protein YdaU (DUF1376 family)
VNYYSRYPAHYLAATLHLSMEQDGAYNRLMDWAYSNETPIPDDKKYIIARAQNSREKRAINDVLSEFFLLTESGWVQRRIEAEISKAAPKIEAARINGLKGGRPPKQKPSGFPENNPVGFQDKTQQEPSAKAPQSPIPNNQSKAEATSKAEARSAKSRGTRLPTDWTPDTELIGWARAERSGVDLTTETAKFRDYWIAKPGASGCKLDWDATFRNWIRSARDGPPKAAATKPPIAQNFSAKTYTGTPDDELPSFLRAAQA